MSTWSVVADEGHDWNPKTGFSSKLVVLQREGAQENLASQAVEAYKL